MNGLEIAGVLSDQDAGGRSGAAVRAGRTVADRMTTHVATAEPTATIRAIANLMRGRPSGASPSSITAGWWASSPIEILPA